MNLICSNLSHHLSVCWFWLYNVKASEESLWFMTVTRGQGTCWYGNRAMDTVPVAAATTHQWFTNDVKQVQGFGINYQCLRETEGNKKIKNQRVFVRCQVMWRHPVSQRLMGAVMSGRRASAYNTQTLEAQHRLHLFISATSVTAEESTKHGAHTVIREMLN